MFDDNVFCILEGYFLIYSNLYVFYVQHNFFTIIYNFHLFRVWIDYCYYLELYTNYNTFCSKSTALCFMVNNWFLNKSQAK